MICERCEQQAVADFSLDGTSIKPFILCEECLKVLIAHADSNRIPYNVREYPYKPQYYV